MARIAIVSGRPEYITRIRELSEAIQAKIVEVGPPAEGAGTGIDAILAPIMSQRPDAVLLAHGLTMEERVEITKGLDLRHPEVVVVWVVEEDADAWRLATRAGARDLLNPQASAETIIAQLRSATGIAHQRRTSGDVEPTGPELGRIISVVSPKGGSGKTMLSTNLAVGLAEDAANGVVLVDLDLQFGDTSSALGLRPQYSVIDVINAGGDATATKAFLTPHMPGLFVLPGPSNPAEADDAGSEGIAKLLAMLRAEFSYVIVDTGAGIDEPTLTAVEQATDVVFITTIDVAAIQSLRKALVVYDRLQLDQHDRWFVLNRADSRTGLSSAEIEEVTGLAIDAEIPSHRSISKSMNQGSPAIIDQRRSKVGKALLNATALFSTSDKRSKRGQS